MRWEDAASEMEGGDPCQSFGEDYWQRGCAAPLEIGVETLTLHRAFSMLNVILLKLFGNQSTSAT